MADAGDPGCVGGTYDALPWIERCLESVASLDTVVVDNGSRDGTANASTMGVVSARARWRGTVDDTCATAVVRPWWGSGCTDGVAIVADWDQAGG